MSALKGKKSLSLSCIRPDELVEFGHVSPKFQKDICRQVYVPSWSLESNYSNGTLIHNWSEERRRFNHDAYFQPFPISIMKHEYRPPCNPSLVHYTEREKHAIRMQRGAIPNELFFRHHGKRHNCNKITVYDEIYNMRRFTDEHGLMRFPDERKWSVLEDEWRPETSDYPLQGNPTNWGLLESIEDSRRKRTTDSDDRYTSVYRKSFDCKPTSGDSAMTRYATPRDLSFKYNKQDTINRDTDFARGKQPERLWHMEKTSDLCEPRNPCTPLYD